MTCPGIAKNLQSLDTGTTARWHTTQLTNIWQTINKQTNLQWNGQPGYIELRKIKKKTDNQLSAVYQRIGNEETHTQFANNLQTVQKQSQTIDK